MCGISGVIQKNNNLVEPSVIETMTDIIAHRGPDSSGYYYGSNFAFGHRRLAIIDLTSDGVQPMHYNNLYTIVYNGEIYNYIELKEQLVQDGYQFKTHTDTEVIMASYDRWGEECVNHFNGMWSFTLHDKKKQVIFCSRDRFGVKPFYYISLENVFLFGSEIKQLLTNKNVIAKLNKPRAVDFLAHGIFDHTEETLFEGIYQLRGGHNLTYNLTSHQYKIDRWYDLHKSNNGYVRDFNTACFKLRNLFEDSVRLRLRSDVKVGSCLSGGLDSSSIVCMMNDILRESNDPSKQETVSSCSELKKFDEQEFIDEVIKKTGVVSHKVFPSVENLFKELDKIIWHQDEPFGSTSIFAQWNVFKTAKEYHITVMLDGQGSDEQLAGYHPFYAPFFAALIRKFNVIRFYHEARSLKHIHGYSILDVIQLTVKSLLPQKMKRALSIVIKRRRLKWLNVQSDQKCISPYGLPAKLDKLSLDQITHSRIPMLLHYEDRNSMAFSVESRVPFLDYRLVEFILGLPDDYKIHNAKTKYILRESLKNLLPEKISNRYDKMGFVTPEIVWIKENAELFRKEIQKACNNLFPLVNEAEFMKWYENQYLTSNNASEFTVWRLICLGRWVKVFNIVV